MCAPEFKKTQLTQLCCKSDACGGSRGDSGRGLGLGRMANAKSIGWAIYAAGFVIWFFGYLSVGHAPAFDWDVALPWWSSSFVPNREAEVGLALPFVSMVPIYCQTILGWWRRRRQSNVAG